jgi:arylsulfatase A-like enzyme
MSCQLRQAIVASILAVTLCGVASAAQQAKRPNIVVILVDDLGYADLSVHGSQDIHTPSIDSIASNGVRCTSGYVSGVYCSPTRAALLTGRYQQRYGHEFNPAQLAQGGKGQGLSPKETTVASRLQAAGYVTGLIGKWHLGEEDQFHPLNRGFSEFFGFLPGAHSYFKSDDKARGPIYRGRQAVELDGYLTDVLAREAVAFIDRHQKKPFFLYLAFNAVHTPMEAPESMVKKFDHVKDPTRRTYLAMLASLDEAVGKVLHELHSSGLEDNTLVFFLSDNGGPCGKKFAANASNNTPLRGSKGDTWEGGIRVPFFVQWTGKLPPGTRYDHPVIQLDIAATALELAGVQIKPDWKLDGVNLVPFLDGKNTGPPHAALYWRFGEQMAIRKGQWKLVRPDLDLDVPFVKIAERPMLFNLAQDIGEKTDLSAKHPEKVQELQKDWQQWNAQLAPPSWPHHAVQKPKK